MVKCWFEIIGCYIIEGYGMIECLLLIVVFCWDFIEYIGFIGVFVLNMDICIMDDIGNEMLIGECGEFWVKGF